MLSPRPDTPPRLSRRGALLAALASTTPLGCQRPRAFAGAASSDPDWGGLQVARTDRLREDEKGGLAVVLLHGWGAPGDDLVPLGEALARPGSRFFFPVGPLVERGGGRAWWHLDLDDRPTHAWESEPQLGHQPHQQVIAVRSAIQTILKTIVTRYAPTTLAIGGFSQGAMVALDVALSATPPVDRVAALSGVLLADSLPALRSTTAARPRAFVSHGRHDPVLPFAAGERAKDILEEHGVKVTWRPFEGGHEIPRATLAALDAFLFATT